MYNPIINKFYPRKIEGGSLRQEPLKKILLGEVIADPFHPDPAIQAFLRYVPSLILQVLALDLEEDEWNDLTQAGVEADCYQAFKTRLSTRLEEREDFFTLHPDKNGFYQHHEVKSQALSGEEKTGCKKIEGSEEGMDGLLIHAASGNNHTHSKRPGLLRKICPACALISLIHHDYFCVVGLAGPTNLRGNQAYLCMIGENAKSADDSFKRMIRNTFFSKQEETIASLGWDKTSEIDQPSWLKQGRKKKGIFEVSVTEAGLVRAILNTPRHAFFEIEETHGECDLCGLETDQLVTRYYWRKGDKFSGFIGHPTLATYMKESQTLPQNYNPSVWRGLGTLVLKNSSLKNSSSKSESKAAPLVRQFLDFREETGETEFQLELQAYQTDKAKLLGFHYQTIELPGFSKEEGDAQIDFYQDIEDFVEVMSEMLKLFKAYGSKKRNQVQVPGVADKQKILSQEWGKELINHIRHLRQEQKDGSLFQTLLKRLQSYKNKLIQEFETLSESFALDDCKSQVQLRKQKLFLSKKLAGQLKKYDN